MHNILISFLIGLALSGCASALPTCDGLDQRPVNVPPHVGVTYPSCGATA